MPAKGIVAEPRLRIIGIRLDNASAEAPSIRERRAGFVLVDS